MIGDEFKYSATTLVVRVIDHAGSKIVATKAAIMPPIKWERRMIMSSQAILKNGRGTAWRIALADEAIEYQDDGYIYQQEGKGLETYVIHSCKNLGEPFNSARHRAAAAVFAATLKMPRAPKGKKEKNAAIVMLREIWAATE